MRVAALLLPPLVLAVGCAPDRGEWTAKKEALLARLPHYPGSTRVATQTLEIEEGSDLTSHVVGYSTHVSYRPPPPPSARSSWASTTTEAPRRSPAEAGERGAEPVCLEEVAHQPPRTSDGAWPALRITLRGGENTRYATGYDHEQKSQP